MTRLLILSCVLLVSAFASGCGPTSTEISDAMTHRCEMERLEAEMAADPSRTDLREQYIERGEFLRMVIEGTGSPDRMRKILAERTCA